ncbi:MAG: AEC family transporter, partial [Phycisphaerae bacterium]
GLVSGLVGRWTAPAKHRQAFRVICTFHNAGYLNIPIVAALYGPGQRYGISADQMLVVLFLFILGISPLMWSLGVRWLRADASGPATHSRRRLRQMISPPFLAHAVAVSLCLLDLPPRISPAVLQRVLAPVQWTGACTIPLMMLVLGGILAGLRPDQRLARGSVLAAAVMRFLLLPALGLAVLMWLLERGWLSKAYAVILFLQTMMPTATGMAVAARRYGTPATSEYVGGTVFALYVASIGAIPAWLAVWGLVVGFHVP